jgi:predicted RNA-binding protein with TRAM domain
MKTLKHQKLDGSIRHF